MRPLLGGKKVRQKPSHARLLRTIADPPPSRPSKLDAIIMPASRPASFLNGLIDLSASLGTLLVVLCSLQTRADRVAARVAETPGARALLVELPPGFEIQDMPSRTADPLFTKASADRRSDLSTKRNLGLLLARLNGWKKIAFLDDDITLRDPAAYLRLARQLEHSSIAGMVCREFPDNSVVCHARRLAKLPQDNFVSGSVLGVHCGDPTLPSSRMSTTKTGSSSAKRSLGTNSLAPGLRLRLDTNPSPTRTGLLARNSEISSPKAFTPSSGTSTTRSSRTTASSATPAAPFGKASWRRGARG
jgi:hypothetical protein